MYLYLIRHTDAVDAHAAGGRDPDRHLSSKGRSSARQVGEKLGEMGVGFDRVWTSPYVRAVQTAEILSASAGYSGAVETLPALAGGAWSASRIAAVLEPLPPSGHYALVGHNPDMEEMAARLLEVQSGTVSFKKGTVCCLALAGTPFETGARFEWLLRAKALSVVRTL